MLTTAVVIDDDRDTVDVFAEFLRMHKVKVVAVGYDGMDAVEIYRKHRPDIVFLDLEMPKYDGIYGLREIMAINPQAIVAIITADLNKDAEERLSDFNPAEIIFKPFDTDKITFFLYKIKGGKKP